MTKKIKFHAFHVLFRLFAFLADKSGGWQLFVRPKLLIGSLIVGLGLSVNMQIDAQNQTKKNLSIPLIFKNAQNNSKNELNDSVMNNKFDEDHIYTVVEQMPQYPGEEEAMLEFINKNIIHPPIAQCYNGVEGKVICRFVVEKDGSVSNVSVIRSLDPACDKEAVRILKLLPNFIPGKQNGKVVRVYYTVPVTFRLE